MTVDIYLSSGDQRPSISDTLQDAAGTAVILTGLTVRFYARRASTTTMVIDGATATITGALYGQVLYDLSPADVIALTPGIYHCFWRVTFGDTTTQRHPNDRYLVLQVSPS